MTPDDEVRRKLFAQVEAWTRGLSEDDAIRKEGMRQVLNQPLASMRLGDLLEMLSSQFADLHKAIQHLQRRALLLEQQERGRRNAALVRQTELPDDDD